MEIIIIIWGDGGKKEVIMVYFQLVFMKCSIGIISYSTSEMYAVKLLNGKERVGCLPRKYSRIVLVFSWWIDCC